MTIIEAIKEVMRLRNAPMTIRETYEAIAGAGYYTFHAENPVHVVASQIRRHCKGLDFPSASDTKHFELTGEGKYYLLKRREIRRRTAFCGADEHQTIGPSNI
jgi:restriction system protein